MPLNPVTAKPQEAESIKQLDRILRVEGQSVKILGANGEEIIIPDSVYQVLCEVVHAMALGKVVSVVTQNQELTTQAAANLLNVSRPYLIKLLEQGEIPYIQVGTHRRVRFEDLMKYKEQRDIKRSILLDELIQMSQEWGFYE